MDNTAARVRARTALVADAFWEALGHVAGGWQVAVEDWRPGRTLCERCGRPAGLVIVIVHPGGGRVERLAEDCLSYAGLPGGLADAAGRALRVARNVGKQLDSTPGADDHTLAQYHPAIQTALDAGLGVAERWRRLARAVRGRAIIEDALRTEGLPTAYAPQVSDLVAWWQLLEACPEQWPARRRANDLIPLVLDGTATPKQAVLAAKLLRTPWQAVRDEPSGSWRDWGVWPAEVPAHLRPGR